MNRRAKRILVPCLTLISLLVPAVESRSQSTVAASRPPAAVTILDSTKAQDGLNGSVRRVKTEFAKVQMKAGQMVEGPRQLVEITTYDLAGKRIENASFPMANSSVGKEEYKYDNKGNIIEMTMRGENGSILSRETYSYQFDRLGNWTRMVTNLVVFESGELSVEPVEVTYRSFTYYFDDSIAKIVDAPSTSVSPTLPQANIRRVENIEILNIASTLLEARELLLSEPLIVADPPPQVTQPPQLEGTGSSERADRTSGNAETPASADRTANSNSPTAKVNKEEKPNRSPGNSRESPTLSDTSTVISAPKTSVPKTAEASPREAVQLLKVGNNRLRAGDLAGAVEAYSRSVELEPDSAEAYLGLGEAFLTLKKDKDAIRAFKNCLRLNPNVAEAHYGMGYSSFRTRHALDAANSFRRATLIDPKMAKAHYGLALAYQEIGNARGVFEEYRVLESLDKNLAKQLARAFPNFDLPCRFPPFCN